ncbi:hypothetical protein UCRPC4_g05100 [Phaeomoniella chlamydospora]|uniref:Uncharacterized protein n=1 Tax=Phaeomoniella chlamydospora TaxID=158046 RepID=A0A0G2GMQ7_PHACM|nr:hypothetical protein UCRPC4_g05100 [Phaeomoniella chlamydospora]
MESVRPHPIGTGLGVQDISPVSPVKQTWESPTDSETTYLYPSPVSPTTAANRSWVKPSGASHRTTASQSTFDERVIEADKVRAQTDLEKLYAAVAIHEDEKEEQKEEERRAQENRSPDSLGSPRHDAFPGLPSSPRPQNFSSTTLASPRQEQFGMAAMTSPRQEQFATGMLSPQHAQFAAPMMSPQYDRFSYGQMPLSPGQLSHPMAPTPVPISPPQSPKESRLSKANPLSFFSSRNRNSTDKKDSFRMSVKNLPISNPLASPRLKNSVGLASVDEASAQRGYGSTYPPPTPGQNLNSLNVMPTIPQSAEPSPQPPIQISKAPSPAPRAGPPAPLTLGVASLSGNNGPATAQPNKSIGELPLRSYGPTPPQSAPYTRVQFADRRESRINPGPKTGVPYPHSPYMPFSPVTPVSATIKTGKELKLAKKIAKRMDGEEMVKSDDEIWGN